eukprot:6178589-Pleurochrysis_carterae.AAC.3
MFPSHACALAGGVPIIAGQSFGCPSDWNDVRGEPGTAGFFSRVDPTVSTCDDGNPASRTTLTPQQEDRSIYFRFRDVSSYRVRLETIGFKEADVSRNFLFSGAFTPFECPPPPASPPPPTPPPSPPISPPPFPPRESPLTPPPSPAEAPA